MIEKIIAKCLAVLQEPQPDISYVRGMLETLLATQEKPKSVTITAPSTSIPQNDYVIYASNSASIDEADILNARARARLLQVQKMSTIE